MSKALALSVIESSDQFSCLTKSQIFRYVNYYKIFFFATYKNVKSKRNRKVKTTRKWNRKTRNNKRKNNNKIRNTRKKIERINKKEKIEIEKIRETKRVIKEIKELEEIEIEFKKLEI